ncbi:hypothetical protein D9757_005283 [Collybiopsis confluens]|uniref:YjgF-like protein n=1 Tax=Collybiopsis confluens TaxID=2823264 RepID=A0A8H5HVL3_9AGAR|nr:hypothetical protein D9757_005283 [Collybiopsis confluens]
MPYTIENNGCTYYKTSNPWEKKFGHSRAVRKGPFIFVSGTVSCHPETGEMMYADSAHEQARFIFETIVKAVEDLGGEKKDILKVRMFVSMSEYSMEVGMAFKECFGNDSIGHDTSGETGGDVGGPAGTMIMGVKLVGEDMKVEIEAEAVVI